MSVDKRLRLQNDLRLHLHRIRHNLQYHHSMFHWHQQLEVYLRPENQLLLNLMDFLPGHSAFHLMQVHQALGR
jgi:alpha-D-ribose 1-methylphosphonate 5-triphosphate diphosphatase PhnM